jgi:hypothetical protein
MRAIFATLLFLGLLAMTSCIEGEPGEVSVNCTRDGRSQSCVVMVFNESGKQIDEKATDEFGIQYIKNLKPGTYTFKFKDGSGTMYPAEKVVTVGAGDSTPIKVELNEAPPPPTE